MAKAAKADRRGHFYDAVVAGNQEDDETRVFVNFEGLGVLSRAAFRLHGFGIVNSLRNGHPGFVSDDYLNAISADVTVTVLELEAAGIWVRSDDGYSVVADDLLRSLIDLTESQNRVAGPDDAGPPHIDAPPHIDGDGGGIGRVSCTARGHAIDPQDGDANPQ